MPSGISSKRYLKMKEMKNSDPMKQAVDSLSLCVALALWPILLFLFATFAVIGIIFTILFEVVDARIDGCKRRKHYKEHYEREPWLLP